MGKSIEGSKALLEEIASNNYHQSSKRANPKRGSRKYEVDAMTLLASRVDALAQRLDRVGTPPILRSSSRSLIRVCAICEICGIQAHRFTECYHGSSTIEHANALHSFNPPLQNNPYSNAYNSGRKSHSNPPYGNPTLQPQSFIQLPRFQYRAPYNLPPLPPQPKSNLESLMEHCIQTQTKNNKALRDSINQLTSKFETMATTRR